MVDWNKNINLKTMVVFAFMVYFVVLNERKIIIESGPDSAIIQLEKELIEVETKVESNRKLDSIHMKKIFDYANKIAENNDVVDDYSNEQLDSIFAKLTSGE